MGATILWATATIGRDLHGFFNCRIPAPQVAKFLILFPCIISGSSHGASPRLLARRMGRKAIHPPRRSR